MSRGKKLDLFIGTDLGDGWSQVREAPQKETTEILEPGKHMLVFKKEKRRGKTVTLVGPFQLAKTEAEAVLKRVKKQLGSRGSYKAPWMEFQGECADRVGTLLQAEGFRLKRKN